MQVWALRNSDGSFRARFHRHDSYDCAGRRMHEEKHPELDDYVLVELTALEPDQKACQFECCFHGLTDAAAVAARSPGKTPVPTQDGPRSSGIVVGDTVDARDIVSGKTEQWKIVHAAGPGRPMGTISSESPLAQALLGREVGDEVSVGLPRGTRQLEIQRVSTEDNR